MSEPIHVDDDSFDKAVLKSALPVVVDFWAPWCAPCRMVAPTLDKIAMEYGGRLAVAKVNTDDNTKWAAHFRVSGIPTLLFISGGQVRHQQVGALSYGVLKRLVDEFLAAHQSEHSANN